MNYTYSIGDRVRIKEDIYTPSGNTVGIVPSMEGVAGSECVITGRHCSYSDPDLDVYYVDIPSVCKCVWAADMLEPVGNISLIDLLDGGVW